MNYIIDLVCNIQLKRPYISFTEFVGGSGTVGEVPHLL